MSLQVDLGELEKVWGILLDQLKAQHGTVLEVEGVDEYWAIPAAARYNPYEVPTELTLGQLSDDLLEIRAIAQGATPPLPTDLVKLSAVLTLLGRL